MKNDLYKRLQHRLTILFLIITIMIAALILVLIMYFNMKGDVLAAKSMLSESSFLYFYRNHTWEINIFLFAGSFTLLLLVFIISFFHSMNVLILTMQQEPIKRKPLLFLIVPEFSMAQKKVMDMITKHNDSRDLSIKEKEHKNELLMYLAHDLKTPLTSMIGYLNHVLDHDLNEEEQAVAIAITNEKAKRLDVLIDEFTEVLRYDDKVSQLELSRIDLVMLLHQQLTGFYPLMNERGITLKEDLEDDLFIIGDFDKLIRVFDNLMRNAINYSVENTQIMISAKKKEKFVELKYQNHSEQLKEDAAEHLFDKFYRASTARTSTSGGAGLGLAIVKEIVSLHHGHISADIKNDVITFTIQLPYRQEVL